MSDADELLGRAQKLHQRLVGLRVDGPGWSGNSREGFIFDAIAAGVGGSSTESSDTDEPPPGGGCTSCGTIDFNGVIIGHNRCSCVGGCLTCVPLGNCPTCHFTNPCDSSRKFLSRLGVTNRYAESNIFGPQESDTGFFYSVDTIDPISCVTTTGPCSCTGHLTLPFVGPPFNQPGGDCDYSICAPVSCTPDPFYGPSAVGRGIVHPGFDGPGCSIGEFYCPACAGSTGGGPTFCETNYPIASPCCNPACPSTNGFWTNRLVYYDECI